MPIFRKFSPAELDFISEFKVGELVAEKKSTVLHEGANSAHIYTVLAGWGFRYKTLDDGRRQILNFVFPGDLIGLQAAVLKEMEHSVEALSDMLLCVFQRERFWEIYSKYPNLGFDITWLASREERLLDEHLLNVGRRSAEERMAFLFIHLFDRAQAVGMTGKSGLSISLTQQHVADALGLSLVHTNKTLRKLSNSKMVSWDRQVLVIKERDRLEELAKVNAPSEELRPLI